MLALRLAARTLPRARQPLASTALVLGHFSQLKQLAKSQKVQKANPKTQIVSLLSEQLQQLSSISHYASSVQFLQRNQLERSYNYLQFALSESRNRFPQSINLHMFLMNRISILLKIANKGHQFVATLEELFFMSLSLKGDKSLETDKHLRNYLNSLILYDAGKMVSMFEFLEEQSCRFLLKKSEYYRGICYFLNGQHDKGIEAIKKYDAPAELEVGKVNNLSWFSILRLAGEGLDYVRPQDQPQMQQILKDLISILVTAQKNRDLKTNQTEQAKNSLFVETLVNYLSNPQIESLKSVNPLALLLNSHSHIVVMNIAHALYLLKQPLLSNMFLKISFQSSMQLQQPDRIGMGMILLAKINYIFKSNWEKVILDVLTNCQMYSNQVVREMLFTYSKLLFLEKRYYEAQGYKLQSERIEGNLPVEGVILPQFDFSY